MENERAGIVMEIGKRREDDRERARKREKYRDIEKREMDTCV